MWMTFDDSSILFASMIMRESKDFLEFTSDNSYCLQNTFI